MKYCISGEVINMTEMTKVEKEIADRLAVMLLSGFRWNRTKEGEQYWHEVYKALQRIAKEGY